MPYYKSIMEYNKLNKLVKQKQSPTINDSKENLIKSIKEWVKIDNEIRELQKQQLLRKVEKKKISETLIEIMRNNEIDCFDINDGQIIYNKKSVKKPITKKILFDILSKYYKGDSNKAEDMQNYILENREEVIKESIVRTITGNLRFPCTNPP